MGNLYILLIKLLKTVLYSQTLFFLLNLSSPYDKTFLTGCRVFLCDFHREQAWDRWLSKASNGCREIKTDVLALLRRVARSTSVTASDIAIKQLKESRLWKDKANSKLAAYIEQYWLTVKERWIWAHRQDRLLVNCNTNNGTERQNESFKYQYLSFGDENSMPHCSCPDWKMSAYPCKHFFAIFVKYPSWSWDALPSAYRNSPFMVLDDVLTIENERNFGEPSMTKPLENEQQQLEDISNDQKLANEIGQPKRPSGPSGPTVRELIDEIRRASFLVEDNNSLISELHTKLQEIKSLIYKEAPAEKGIHLRQITPKKKPIKKMKSLNIRKRKLPFQGRVGEKKERLMQACSITIDKSEACFKEDVVEEIVSDNQEQLGSTIFVTSVDRDTARDISTDSDEINTNLFVGRQQLNKHDLKKISENDMLNDSIIHVFQSLMLKDHPESNGLQDPVLGQNLSFNVHHNKPFVQILHDGKLHWIAVSTYGCEPGEVFYLDSLFSGRISEKVKQQLCAIMHSSMPILKINVVPVQQQSNGVDCGAYAIAFTNYILKEKRNPTEVTFDQQTMRHNLLRSLAANKMLPFPITTKTVRRCCTKTISLELYCSCRMCWVPFDNNIFGRQMAECSGCNNWFHRSCERIKPEFFVTKSLQWFCYHCKRN